MGIVPYLSNNGYHYYDPRSSTREAWSIALVYWLNIVWVKFSTSTYWNDRINLSPDPMACVPRGRLITDKPRWYNSLRIWGQASWLHRQHIRVGSCSVNRAWPLEPWSIGTVSVTVTARDRTLPDGSGVKLPLTTEQGYCRMFLNMKDNKKQKKTTRKKKDNSKKGDYFLFCRCCTSAIAPDWRSVRDTRYCKDCL